MTDYKKIIEILRKTESTSPEAFYLMEDNKYKYIVFTCNDEWYETQIAFDKKTEEIKEIQ